MRFVYFQLQPVQYGPEPLVSYSTDEIDEPKLKTYNEFLLFLFSSCKIIKDKYELTEELNKYEYIALNVKQGIWEAIPPERTKYTLFDQMKIDKQEAESKNSLISGMFTNLKDSINNLKKSEELDRMRELQK